MEIQNNSGWPDLIYQAITKRSADYAGGYKKESLKPYISATTLLKPQREYLLTQQHKDEIKTDVSRHLNSFIGSAVHEYIDNALKTLDKETLSKINNDEQNDIELQPVKLISDYNLLGGKRITEYRMYHEFPDFILSGQIDFFHVESGTLVDYKTSKAWSAVFGAKDDWEKQANIYSWLLTQEGYTVNKLRIIRIYVDWDQYNAQRSGGYPEAAVEEYSMNLWPADKQLDFITQNAARLLNPELSECSPEERWQKDTTYAVVKNTNKTASRVLDSLEAAQEWTAQQDQKHKWSIVIRPGEARKCPVWCDVAPFCDQWKSTEQYEKGFTK